MTDAGRPVLLAYDGSDNAKRAIAAAAELLGPGRALVIHLWQSWVAEAPALAGTSASVHGMAAELDSIANEQSAAHTAEGAEETAAAH